MTKMSNVSNVDVQSLWVCWSRSELLYSALIIFDWYALYSAFIFFHLLSYVLLRSLSCSRSIHRYQMKLAVFVDGVGPFRFALYTTRRSWRHRSVTPPSGWNIFWNRKNCCWRPKTRTSWLEQWCDESLTVAQRFVFHCLEIHRLIHFQKLLPPVWASRTQAHLSVNCVLKSSQQFWNGCLGMENESQMPGESQDV